MEHDRLKTLLEREAARINVPEFVTSDPVQFPRRYTTTADVEIVSLLVAAIAWGNRKMICNNCERLLAMMGGSPLQYVLDEEYEHVADEQNIHRTFFGRNLKHALRGMRDIYRRHATLNDYARHNHVGDSEVPAWTLAGHLLHDIAAANGGVSDARFLPVNLRVTALKRLNMALRWLVRDDGIVDMGVWNALKPSQLFIPLDVHVGNTARSLGITARRAADRRTVMEITGVLRALRPHDPVYYDYALFGLGVNGGPITV